ncbi:MAG: DUF1007 family protein [Campylobacterota bacterium]|nr:DUF1007 family protein [Campylobacterota bacterium]
MKKYLILSLFTLSLFAHPHTFIDVYPTINIKDGKAQTIHFKWKIDEMTSSMLIMDVDSDGDGKINSKENRFIRDTYFTVFTEYNYYTHIKIDGKTIPFPQTKNFKASIENHRVCYSFDIEGDFDMKRTIIEVGDSDFYVAMVLKQEFLSIKGMNAQATGVDNEFYYGYKVEFN